MVTGVNTKLGIELRSAPYSAKGRTELQPVSNLSSDYSSAAKPKTRYIHFHLFCFFYNPILFAACTRTFSILSKNLYNDM
jgi:hypothetical protein